MLVPIKLKCSRYQYLGHNSGYTLNALNMLRQILSGNDVILVLEDLAYTCRGIGKFHLQCCIYMLFMTLASHTVCFIIFLTIALPNFVQVMLSVLFLITFYQIHETTGQFLKSL